MAGSADSGQPRPVVLVGFMGAGKSKIGRLLAKRLGLPFVDSDKAIEESAGLSVADIFRERGETAFREAERALIGRLLEEGPQIIALGGGAFADERNRATLNRGARTVWLDAPFEEILPRLKRSANRPLASDKSEAELRALWIERRPYYAEAQIHIGTWISDPARIVERIVAELNAAG